MSQRSNYLRRNKLIAQEQYNKLIMSIENRISLSKHQQDFLKKHRIPLDILIDAQGGPMSTELKQRMINEEKHLAYNTRSCSANSSHNFKTNAGHCPQCNTAVIAFSLREYLTGFIYLAGSKKGELIKIGLTNEIAGRIKTLNSAESKYGGYEDWEILFHVKADSAGKVERMIQEKLKKYEDSRQYEKSGNLQSAKELFRCSFKTAKSAFLDVLSDENANFNQLTEKPETIISGYLFRNLIAK